MIRKRKIIATAIAPALMAGAFALFGPATTASAATCYGSGCTGLDPSKTGCASDAYTLDTYWPFGTNFDITVDLRYSPSCHAAWARSFSSTSQTISGVILGESYRSGNWIVMCDLAGPNRASGTAWSPMCGGYGQYEVSSY